MILIWAKKWHQTLRVHRHNFQKSYLFRPPFQTTVKQGSFICFCDRRRMMERIMCWPKQEGLLTKINLIYFDILINIIWSTFKNNFQIDQTKGVTVVVCGQFLIINKPFGQSGSCFSLCYILSMLTECNSFAPQSLNLGPHVTHALARQNKIVDLIRLNVGSFGHSNTDLI